MNICLGETQPSALPGSAPAALRAGRPGAYRRRRNRLGRCLRSDQGQGATEPNDGRGASRSPGPARPTGRGTRPISVFRQANRHRCSVHSSSTSPGFGLGRRPANVGCRPEAVGHLRLDVLERRRRPTARQLPTCFLVGQRHIPHTSSRRLPVTPAHTRESPQATAGKGLLTGGIPAYSRSARNHQDRPVTPEVAGSSPVAPAKVPANRHLFSPLDRRLLAHPAQIPQENRPRIPAESRS